MFGTINCHTYLGSRNFKLSSFQAWPMVSVFQQSVLRARLLYTGDLPEFQAAPLWVKINRSLTLRSNRRGSPLALGKPDFFSYSQGLTVFQAKVSGQKCIQTRRNHRISILRRNLPRLMQIQGLFHSLSSLLASWLTFRRVTISYFPVTWWKGYFLVKQQQKEWTSISSLKAKSLDISLPRLCMS